MLKRKETDELVKKSLSRAVETLKRKRAISIERVGLAIKDGDVGTVIKYIESGGNLEERTHNDWTPLHLAALYGKNFIGLLLLEAKADGNALHKYDRGSVSPLGLAVANSTNTGILIDQLIKRGFLPSSQTKRKQLLESALNHGNIEASKLLIISGVEIDESMWHEAYATGNKLSYHFDSKPFVNELKAFLEDFHASEGRKKVKERYQYDIRKAIKEVLSVVNSKESRTINIRKSNNIVDKLVSEVLSEQSKILKEEESLSKRDLLIRASERGDYDNVRRLLNSNKYSQQILLDALYYATQEQHIDIVRLFVNENIDLNGNPTSNIPPLHRAAYENAISIAEILLKGNANPNFIAQGGDTALSYAAYAGNEKMVGLLIRGRG